MAIARGKVTIHGTLSNGADVWNTGFHVGALTGATQGEIQSLAQAVYDHWLTEVWEDVGLEPFISDVTAFLGVRVDDVSAANITVRTAQVNATGPIYGPTDVQQLPGEVAEVVSLRTETPGARGRGRMYLPPLGINAMAKPGTLSGTAVTNIVSSLKRFFDEVNDGPPEATVCVYSGVNSALYPVRSIRVGNVPDSQRRRRNSQVEAYTTDQLV